MSEYRPTLWPPFSLRIQVEDLELIAVDDSHIYALSTPTAAEIYGPEIPDHAFVWLGGDRIESAKFRWANRVSMSPMQWSLDLVALKNGEIVGATDLRAKDFARMRSIETGSWVYYQHQGKGYGTLIRHAVATYGFDYLGADDLTTAWAKSNPASGRVSQKLGYEITGDGRIPEGLPCHTARLSRFAYRRGAQLRLPKVTVTGHTPELHALLVG